MERQAAKERTGGKREELEEELSDERSRLRALMTEQTAAERQREKITYQLRRTETVRNFIRFHENLS